MNLINQGDFLEAFTKVRQRGLNYFYFQNRSELKLLSVACGVGNREIKLAESGHFKEVLGIDLSLESINEANRKVKEKGAMQYSV
jgi:2-polyprenyl-3-methyl-5-hydroxy-6-metoxy-1,4-benzoquinol methylase